jgi:hypothetical protein
MNQDTQIVIVYIIFIVLICSGIGTCKKWQYDECIQVGHDKSYCVASTAGCFSTNK